MNETLHSGITDWTLPENAAEDVEDCTLCGKPGQFVVTEKYIQWIHRSSLLVNPQTGEITGTRVNLDTCTYHETLDWYQHKDGKYVEPKKGSKT